MDAIAVIDDTDDMRTTIAGLIRHELGVKALDWQVIDAAPLRDIADYREWVVANDVRVLVLDEKLRGGGKQPVEYLGHEVAESLRRQLPDLPQFIITAVPPDEDLDEAAAELDAILARTDFIEHPDRYVERMVRMGKSYMSRHEAEFAELGRLSMAVVNGTVSAQETDRLVALRTSLIASSFVSEVKNSKEWLEQAELLKAKVQEAIALLKAEQDRRGNGQ